MFLCIGLKLTEKGFPKDLLCVNKTCSLIDLFIILITIELKALV